jgi:hypothetical protein
LMGPHRRDHDQWCQATLNPEPHRHDRDLQMPWS